MSACVAGCRWLARVMTYDRDRNGVTWNRRAGEDLARLLPETPVRWARQGAELIHPPRTVDPRAPAFHVGDVVDAWASARDVLALVHLHHDAERLLRALRAIDRDGQLAALAGLSLCAVLGEFHESLEWGRPVRWVHSVQTVHAVDFV